MKIPIPDWHPYAWLLLALLALDALTKALLSTPAWAMHHRSGEWKLGGACMVAAWLLCFAYPPIRLAATLIIAGTLGNVLSALHGDVPNPILFGRVAFNLADVVMTVGCLFAVALLPRAASGWLRARGRRLA